jgi:hypothetical protein
MGMQAFFAPMLFRRRFFAPGFQPSLVAILKTRPVGPGCYAAAPLALVAAGVGASAPPGVQSIVITRMLPLWNGSDFAIFEG